MVPLGGLRTPDRFRMKHRPTEPPPPLIAGLVPLPFVGGEVSVPPLPPVPHPLQLAPGTEVPVRVPSTPVAIVEVAVFAAPPLPPRPAINEPGTSVTVGASIKTPPPELPP